MNLTSIGGASRPRIRLIIGWIGLGAVLGGTAVYGQRLPESEEDEYHGYYKAEASYSGSADIARGQIPLGEMSAIHSRFIYVGSVPRTEDYVLQFGFEVERFGFDQPAGPSIIPDSLQSVSLVLGNYWEINDKWTFRGTIMPGIYSDFEDVSYDDFNVPMSVRLSYEVSESLTLTSALAVDFFDEYPVLGGIGMRWKIDDKWRLNLELPKTKLEYWVQRQMGLFASAELRGGDFRLAKDAGARIGRPELNNEQISYREYRFSGGISYRFSRSIMVDLEGGWMLDRRFEVDDANLQLNGDGAPFVQFALKGFY